MADRITTAVTYTASGSAIAFGFNANELGAIIGATIAVMSFCVNIWFKHQHLQLARIRLEKLHADEGEAERGME